MLSITRPDGKSHRLGLSLPEKGEFPSWWLELQSLAPGQLSSAQVQELTKKQFAGFRLPAAQDNKTGWWNAPLSEQSQAMSLHTRVQIPRYQGHQGGKKGANCDAG